MLSRSLIFNVEEAHIGAPDRGLAIRRLDCDAEQTSGEIKESFQHRGEGEVGAKFLLFELIVLLTKSFRPELNVPTEQQEVLEMIGWLNKRYRRFS